MHLKVWELVMGQGEGTIKEARGGGGSVCGGGVGGGRRRGFNEGQVGVGADGSVSGRGVD